jgi:AraC-like DNA-binding protein
LNNIPNIAFNSSKNATDIEFLELDSLFARIGEIPNHNPKQPHRIDFYALLVVTEGAGIHQVDLKNYNIQAGDIVKVAKGQVHAFRGQLGYKGYLILFTEDFVLKYFSKSSIQLISHLYNYHISQPLIQNCSFNPLFLDLFSEELNKEESIAQKNIIAKLMELYLMKIEQLSSIIDWSDSNKTHYALFFEFKTLVENHYKKTRNVKDYAEMLSISTKHLNQIVQSFTLNTSKHFIDQYVLLEIKRAIQSTSKSLKEIAFDAGFDEVTNFTKFFKKHTQISPKAYKVNL